MSDPPFQGYEPAEYFDNYVEHPRYGKGPRYSGLDVNVNHPRVRLSWHAGGVDGVRHEIKRLAAESRPPQRFRGCVRWILGTAVIGDESLQQPGGYAPVSHYCDMDLFCRGCKRRFIFFAEEQQFWYEHLQFYQGSVPDLCPACRQHQRRLKEKKKRFDALCHESPRSLEQTLEMADCCMDLLENDVFDGRQVQRMREILNAVPAERQSVEPYGELRRRLRAYEARCSRH